MGCEARKVTAGLAESYGSILLTRKLSSIEVRPTASWPWPMTFSFSPLQAMVVIHSCAKNQGQRSVGLKERVETDRWTEAIALHVPPMLTWSVISPATITFCRVCGYLQSVVIHIWLRPCSLRTNWTDLLSSYELDSVQLTSVRAMGTVLYVTLGLWLPIVSWRSAPVSEAELEFLCFFTFFVCGHRVNNQTTLCWETIHVWSSRYILVVDWNTLRRNRSHIQIENLWSIRMNFVAKN